MHVLSAWEKVCIARGHDRPRTLDYIDYLFDSFMEFHGDRSFADDSSIVGGVAKLEGKTVTVIGTEKGKSTKEKMQRNFGMPKPEGYRKALRLMKQAEKFNRPVICFIDTAGAYCGVDAEERGQGQAIAQNIMEMSKLKTPIISVFIGEGGSGGALALAVADKLFMFENSVYSVLSPEGFASILWRNSNRAKEAASVMKMTADELFEYKIVDKVLEEPDNGINCNFKDAFENLKGELKKSIFELSEIDKKALLQNRYDKFRKIGNITIH